MKKFLLLIVLIWSIGYAQSLKLPAVISDNMMLQQKMSVPIWGWSKAGNTITVSGNWDNEKKKVVADSSGKWTTTLTTPAAGGPFTITVAGDTKIVVENVLIGEVWVCSGQSNMEMNFKGWGSNSPVKGAEKTIKEANYPDIRLFKVEQKYSDKPEVDCIGHWEVCSPATIELFSAVAYYFGKEIHSNLKVPVGLIMTAWGGTPAEAWTAQEYMLKYPEFKKKISKLPLLLTDNTFYDTLLTDWKKKTGVENMNYLGSIGKWMDPTLDDKSWEKHKLPAEWSTYKLKDFVGCVWYRKTVEIPADWVSKELIFEFCAIDETDLTWINGKVIGECPYPTSWNKERKYTLKPGIVKAGKNTIAIRVINTFGTGGFYGKEEKLLIYPAAEGKSKAVSLSGEWLFKVDFDASLLPAYPPVVNLKQNLPSVLYNGMIHPLLPFGIRGVIWYQGESNSKNPKLYASLFPEMVKCWRSSWKQGDFPFYYAQIAPFKYYGGIESQYLREVQLKSLDVIPNSGMAVTMDIGKSDNIHPPDKESVGKRLAYLALANTYGVMNVACNGPVYDKMEIKNDKIVLYFKNTDNGLVAKGGELKYFQIAGADKVFVDATAVIEKNTIVVSSAQVKEPVAVRFGFSNDAITNLYNTEELPASSFRTDEW